MFSFFDKLGTSGLRCQKYNQKFFQQNTSYKLKTVSCNNNDKNSKVRVGERRVWKLILFFIDSFPWYWFFDSNNFRCRMCGPKFNAFQLFWLTEIPMHELKGKLLISDMFSNLSAVFICTFATKWVENIFKILY